MSVRYGDHGPREVVLSDADVYSLVHFPLFFFFNKAFIY